MSELLYEIFLCSLKPKKLTALGIIEHLQKVQKMYLLVPLCVLLENGGSACHQNNF